MNNIAIKVDNISKVYRLGTTGGTTLKAEMQSAFAKLLKKEDPNKKIGAENIIYGQEFFALKDISFEVKKGEALGIIGHNGAGKSTLLKLISRVTGPTKGAIYYNGRISSMLEVGTGFHRELTGRENIYLNGTILGMTKSEIDEKFDEIVDFSEVRQFIDTPVKRYSSGMYVKLAFAVASHMNNEIMIMDEVLAVGDMSFQTKCLNKMKDLSENSGKTILYVSHNMNTIRRLCKRVIVLNKGHIQFDGDVEEGIKLYANLNLELENINYDLSTVKRKFNMGIKSKMTQLNLLDKEENTYATGEKIKIGMKIDSSKDIEKSVLMFYINTSEDHLLGLSISNEFKLNKGENNINVEIPTDNIIDGSYFCRIILFSISELHTREEIDDIKMAFYFKIENNIGLALGNHWKNQYYGDILFPKCNVQNKN